jgi:hypothetical protein
MTMDKTNERPAGVTRFLVFYAVMAIACLATPYLVK